MDERGSSIEFGGGSARMDVIDGWSIGFKRMNGGEGGGFTEMAGER